MVRMAGLYSGVPGWRLPLRGIQARGCGPAPAQTAEVAHTHVGRDGAVGALSLSSLPADIKGESKLLAQPSHHSETSAGNTFAGMKGGM